MNPNQFGANNPGKFKLTDQWGLIFLRLFLGGQIAQSVEQRTENQCVPSSILSLATNKNPSS